MWSKTLTYRCSTLNTTLVVYDQCYRLNSENINTGKKIDLF